MGAVNFWTRLYLACHARDITPAPAPKPPPTPIRYEWITASENVCVTANNWPQWTTPLFERWTADGWEIVNVTPMPSVSNCHMCVAVGVLRREIRRA